jgi:hypothetical protein
MPMTDAQKFANHDYDGVVLTGTPKEVMVERTGVDIGLLYDEWVEVTDEYTGYHYSGISTSLFVYPDGSYGIMEG